MTFKPDDFRSEGQQIKTVMSEIARINENVSELNRQQRRANRNIGIINDAVGIQVQPDTGIVEQSPSVQSRVGTAQQGAIGGTAAKKKRIIVPYTWAITGTLGAGSFAAGVVVRSTYTGAAYTTTAKIASASYQIQSGTNVTWKLQKNGADLAGWGTSASPLTATTTVALNESLQTLSDQDTLRPVLVGFSGTPTNFNLTVHLEYTI